MTDNTPDMTTTGLLGLLQDILDKVDLIEREQKVIAHWVAEINLRQKLHQEISVENNEMLTQCMEDDEE